MFLPNARNAIIPMEKLTLYCLSTTHPDGKHKARVFRAALGVSAGEAGELRDRLFRAAQEESCSEVGTDTFGTLYCLDFTWTRRLRQAPVRSIWMIRGEESFPRLVTCYILTGKES